MRCCISACLTFVAAELWASTQRYSIREVMHGMPRILGALCGVVLFLSSLVCLAWDWRLACFGLIISLPAMSLALLPVIAH